MEEMKNEFDVTENEMNEVEVYDEPEVCEEKHSKLGLIVGAAIGGALTAGAIWAGKKVKKAIKNKREKVKKNEAMEVEVTEEIIDSEEEETN